MPATAQLTGRTPRCAIEDVPRLPDTVKQGCRYPCAENPTGLPQTKLSRPVVTIPFFYDPRASGRHRSGTRTLMTTARRRPKITRTQEYLRVL
jgi:hypothetical protein